jgi:RNA polymerase sigma factor (sigma-70 family)
VIATAPDTALLIEGCVANNRKAQESLFRQFYAFGMTVALRYARDEHDAADILSLAFVKIFKSIRSYDHSKGSFHAWMKKIVVNEGLDHIKGRSRFAEHIEVEEVAEPTINNRVLEQMGADEIMMLIKKLPPATHAVFILYAVEGYSHREIAVKLSISEGTSKWHLSEARKTLQKEIQQLRN